jgi:glycosyltransferase involved in cell wall biosynthesis
VDFLGTVEDGRLGELYQRADMLVLPSVARPDARPPEGEGFGLVFAEAGAYGVPAVASAAGGGSLDFVRHGETGLTVPPGDPGALAAAILELIEQPALRDRLGEAARRLVLERHTPARFTRALNAALCG